MDIEESKYWYSILARLIRAHQIDKFEQHLKQALAEGFPIDFMNKRKVTLLNVLGLNYDGSETDQLFLKLLLDAGADVNIKDSTGRSAVTWFTFERFIPIDLFTQIIKAADVSDIQLFRRLATKYRMFRCEQKPNNSLEQIQAFLDSGRDAKEWLENNKNNQDLEELVKLIKNYYETKEQLNNKTEPVFDYDMCL